MGKSNVNIAGGKVAPSGKGWDKAIKGYKCDPKLPQVQRIAHFLAWAATTLPDRTIPYNIICKAINGYGHTPRTNNEEVEATQRRMANARPHLQEKYKRDLISVPGVGARASTSALDVTKNALPSKVRRVNSATASLQKSAALVDVDKLPTAGPDKQWKDYFTRVVSPALKALASDERIARLLPPGKWGVEDAPKKEGGGK